MQHLDEGLLMALLDSELSGSEQQDAETHLQTCAECSARLQELKGFMTEADGLVVALGEPPALSATKSSPGTSEQATMPGRWRITPRALAWAASIVAAAGLGFAGAGMLQSRSDNLSISQGAATEQENAPLAAPAPASASPSELAVREETRQPPNAGTGALSGPVEERTRPEADRSGRLLNDEALAVRQNTGESGQSGIAALDGDLADARAPARDTPSPAAESAAKVTGLTRRQETRVDRFAPAAPTSARARREGTANPVFQRITMEEAVRHLSGAIRLIDGLTPEEFAVAASDSTHPLIRVVYRVGSGESPLFLEQRRADNSFVASDLQSLQSSMEQVSTGNRLSWNDLRGFDLTLTGLISPDSLFHFKTLVK